MNYWIASYPRSGNTFLRILLKEVYGIYTWEGYGEETPQKVLNHKDCQNSKTPIFIKTHELPHKTQALQQQFKTIYLVRDGRDAGISMAHHRCNIVKPGSNYLFNLRTAIIAPFGTSFGGWSKHVNQWLDQADIVIKFEDLISDPKKELKKLESLIDLPKADYLKIPTFHDLKKKKFSLGSGNDDLSKQQQQQRREKFFRSGQINEWKTKMPRDLLNTFSFKHGKILKQLKYSENQYSNYVYFNLVKNYLAWFLGYIKEKFTKS